MAYGYKRFRTPQFSFSKALSLELSAFPDLFVALVRSRLTLLERACKAVEHLLMLELRLLVREAFDGVYQGQAGPQQRHQFLGKQQQRKRLCLAPVRSKPVLLRGDGQDTHALRARHQYCIGLAGRIE